MEQVTLVKYPDKKALDIGIKLLKEGFTLEFVKLKLQLLGYTFEKPISS